MSHSLSHQITERTNRFAGKCDDCVYPIIREIEDVRGDYTNVACPQCGQIIKVTRLYGTYNDTNCDDRCQYAYGPICLCACGGRNHMRGYLPPTFTGEVPADKLAKYRRAVANRKAGAEKRAVNRRANAEAELARVKGERLSEIPSDIAELLSFDTDLNDVAELDDYARNVVLDIRFRFNRTAALSDRQVEFIGQLLLKGIERLRIQAERDAEVKVLAPTGRIIVSGVVISRKEKYDEYSPYGGIYHRITVKVAEDEGVYFVNLREPSAFRTDPGDLVTFRATLERSESEHFAFGKRPSNFSIDGHRELGAKEISALD